MTQPIHPAQPAPMGIPLDELIERAVKHAQYETLSLVAAAAESTITSARDTPLDSDEVRDIVREVARDLGIPAPAALKD